MSKTASVEDPNLKSSISNQILAIGKQIELMTEQAKSASPGSITQATSKAQVDALKSLVGELRAPSAYSKNLSDNSGYYGLGKKSAAVLEGNGKIASSIIDEVNWTLGRIEGLVLAGKKFNAARARRDLHEVSDKLANLLANSDLAAPWVSDELLGLERTASHICGLFKPTRS